MLFSTPAQDRYCRFTYNPNTGEYERDWIEYADGVFEPVRRNGNLREKWEGENTRYQWWCVKKPVDWMPWEHGHVFAWNHSFGDGDKPAGWGGKSEREVEAGRAPYFMEVELNANSRIESRLERIDGRPETWDFQYDDEGRLTAVFTDFGWAQDYEYDDQGRRKADHETGRTPLSRTFEYDDDNRLLSVGNVRYEHDENGFRCAKHDGESVTRYQYAEDYRLIGAVLPDGRTVTFDHDENGQRSMKYVNGQPVEAYLWRDFIRLGAFHDGEYEYVFNYEGDERLPHSMTVNGSDYTLEHDQVGTLKAVVSPTGYVIKGIQYDVFGNLLWDSNPGLRIPLGFAGGLSDPDVGFVRFGWRDYDPNTGRWTAPDPIGDAGGDDDWYGYCLDDPVNAIDPLGLFLIGGIGVKDYMEAASYLDGISWGGGGRSVADGPKYGKWGGKKYSGGVDGGKIGNAEPVDSSDEAYKRHDHNYEKIKNTPMLGDVNKTQKKMKKIADKQLVDELKKMGDDPSKWQNPPAKGHKNSAKLFRKGALFWF